MNPEVSFSGAKSISSDAKNFLIGTPRYNGNFDETISTAIKDANLYSKYGCVSLQIFLLKECKKPHP